MTENSNNQRETITRRSFLDSVLHGSVAMFLVGWVYLIFNYLWPVKAEEKGASEQVEVGTEADFPLGKGKVVKYRDRSAIVIHSKKGFVAFSAVCTHLGCIVKWDEKAQQILCPCHAAVFDVNGNVVAGPPPRPLPPLKIGVVKGKVYLSG